MNISLIGGPADGQIVELLTPDEWIQVPSPCANSYAKHLYKIRRCKEYDGNGTRFWICGVHCDCVPTMNQIRSTFREDAGVAYVPGPRLPMTPLATTKASLTFRER